MWVYIFFLEEWTAFLTYNLLKRSFIEHQFFPDGDIYELNHYGRYRYKSNFGNLLILFSILFTPPLTLVLILLRLDWNYDDEEEELYWRYITTIKLDLEREIPADILWYLSGKEESLSTEKNFTYFIVFNSDYIDNYINIYLQYLAVVFEFGMEEMGEYVDNAFVLDLITFHDYYMEHLLRVGIMRKTYTHEDWEENFKD